MIDSGIAKHKEQRTIIQVKSMKTVDLQQLFRQDSSIREHLLSVSNGHQDGTHFGKYKILKCLGQGSFARVFKAVNTKTQKDVALKVIDLQQMEKSIQSKQFLAKARAYLKTEETNMRKCKSAFIVKVYQSYSNSICKIIVMEYCNGGTLEHLLKRRGALQEADAIGLLREVIFGLAEMHRNGIVHRDLKLANILIHNGVLKVADLGFSKQISLEEEMGSHTALGTRATMAPEVLKRQPYGFKADIWSLGVIFFLMINYDIDYTPFQNYQRAHEFVEKKQRKSVSSYSDCISDKALDFLKRTLEVDQKKRMGWLQTLSHILFAPNSQDLPQFFLPYREEEFRQLKQIKQVEPKMEECQNAESQGPPEQNALNYSEEKINPEELVDYQLLHSEYFECRKAEFLLKKLLVPLDEKHMLDRKEQSHIEMLYLLAFRCLRDLEHAQKQVGAKYSQNISAIFSRQIDNLLKRVSLKFQNLSQMLTESQNRVRSIIKEKVIKLVSKRSSNNRGIFLSGFEGHDFTRKEQIDFTYSKYIVDLINEVKGNPLEEERVKVILKSYRTILFLSQEELGETSFNAFLDKKMKSYLQ